MLTKSERYRLNRIGVEITDSRFFVFQQGRPDLLVLDFGLDEVKYASLELDEDIQTVRKLDIIDRIERFLFGTCDFDRLFHYDLIVELWNGTRHVFEVKQVDLIPTSKLLRRLFEEFTSRRIWRQRKNGFSK